MNGTLKNDLIANLAWGGGILLLALGATLARKLGYIDHDIVMRLVIGANGLMIAWMGNRIPKTFAPSACARQAKRVAGWSLALSGLVYAGLFAFAPLGVAAIGSAAAVFTAIAVTIGYCLTLRDKPKAV